MNAYADPIMLAAIVSLFIVLGMMLWTMRSRIQRRERHVCPERLRPANVLVALGPSGEAVDVLRCSLIGHVPVTCSKACLPARAVGV